MTEQDGESFSLGGRRVWIAGHCGMVGPALERRRATEDREVLPAGREDADLRRHDVVADRKIGSTSCRDRV